MIIEEQNDKEISETVFLITRCHSSLNLIESAGINSECFRAEVGRLREQVIRLELRLIHFRYPLAKFSGVVVIN